MASLTTKELTFIEDELRAEEIIAKTINWCATLCDDEQLKNTLEQLAQFHQENILDLSKYFNRSQDIQ
ncbi:hypothetical protein [Metabacillus malikii]|uniref:Spore coat protein n=1 Tax=Metabacillus malikii TaxID=1504265 RepID=A0ABT9ZCL0_9BACI|nr:hypothetical protein [Metabacillus malikii]MDQ0229992.1 hypothetical protein [Metabacillus malikii]